MSNNVFTCRAILEAIKRIETYSKDFDSADDFYHHELNFDATMMQFVVLGEMVAKLEDTFKEKYTQIPWQEIKDFRNIVAHDYFGIDSVEIWSIIKEHLPDLKNQLQKLID